MPPLRLVIVLTAVTLTAMAAAVACSEGGQQGVSPAPSGTLTQPKSVPTATPWAQPPEVVFLQEGTVVPLPGSSPQPQPQGQEATPTPGQCGDTYTVQSGDSPFSIAQKCGVDIAELMRLNNITDPTKLQVGQVLKLR